MKTTIRVATPEDAAAVHLLIRGLAEYEGEEGAVEVTPGVLGWLRQHGYRCSHMATERADLETVFLTLTGRSVRNA